MGWSEASDGGTNHIGQVTAKQLPDGLYESLMTEGLNTSLNLAPGLQPIFVNIEDEVSPEILTRHVAKAIHAALFTTKPADRVGLANRLLQL